MTDRPLPAPDAALPPAAQPPRGKRTDAATGRAFSGSQMHLQVWVNRRREALSRALLLALPISDPGAQVEWVSPLESEKFGEYKDAAFLSALGLGSHAAALHTFWPRGGPVWDGLARVKRSTNAQDAVVLVEAKSYPTEIVGKGCQAGPESRPTIEGALDETARWLGVSRPDTWTGGLYQSANRIAHVYFLRERLGIEAYLVNLCFAGDPRKPTTPGEWDKANDLFRRQLGLDGVPTPWLIDIILPAARREELLETSP